MIQRTASSLLSNRLFSTSRSASGRLPDRDAGDTSRLKLRKIPVGQYRKSFKQLARDGAWPSGLDIDPHPERARRDEAAVGLQVADLVGPDGTDTGQHLGPGGHRQFVSGHRGAEVVDLVAPDDEEAAQCRHARLREA